MRTPAPLRRTERQQRTDGYRLQWQKHRRRSRAGKVRATIRGSEFIAALEQAAAATGDPRFAEAAKAARLYGLDRGFQQALARIQQQMFGDDTEPYFVQIDFLRTRGRLENGRRRKLSTREACEAVVAESGFPGASFDAAVERLRQRFIARRKR
jgi:hypothetical protein